jgi:uncharacterized protein (DUF1800 family)
MRRKILHRLTDGRALAVLLGVLVSAGCLSGGQSALPVRSATISPGPAPVSDDQIVHLLSRTTYGPRPGDIARVRAMGLTAYIERQLRPESVDDHTVEAMLGELPTLTASIPALLRVYPQRPPAPQPAMAAGEAGRMARSPSTPKGPADIVMELRAAKALRAVASERQLQEVMVDFWFNHFNVFLHKGETRWYVTSYERDAIRPHALGKFGDLLRATARHPAMLYYLDNWLSRNDKGSGKPRLNENYARELMELHTLGVDGGYTQGDVTEVARAFTGWTIDRPKEEGQFVFRPGMHDKGTKVVLGQHFPAGGGIEDGERVLQILVRHPSTARFLATKLVRRFVSDEPPVTLVDRVAAVYERTDGDITAMVRTIVTSAEFASREVYRAKIKMPFEYVVSAARALGGSVDSRGGLELARASARLGQPLYEAQPPTGYPDRAEPWVNTGALVMRINYATALAQRQLLGVHCDPYALTAGVDVRSPEAVLSRLEAEILHHRVSDGTHGTLTKLLADPQIMRSADDRRDHRWANTDVAVLAALVLGAPEFQRR